MRTSAWSRRARCAGSGDRRGRWPIPRVRNISAWHAVPEARGSSATPPPDVLTRAAFREGLRCLASLGLTFDAWMYHTQLGELTALARDVPEATIILDHVGGALGIGPYAGRRDEVFVESRNSIRELAQCPNVLVKLGGLGMRLFGFDVHQGHCRLRLSSSPMHGAPISKPASRRSASRARCSRATFRSTKEAATTRRCGMRSSGLPPALPPPTSTRYSAEPRRGSTDSNSRSADGYGMAAVPVPGRPM